MQNPIAKLVPQYFGEYPKLFQKLYSSVSFGPDQNEEEVKSVLWKAYEFGNRYHEGQKRLSGEPYFSHCIEVASTLAKWNMDTTTIIAGLLHDTLEDTDATLEDITLIFGQELGSLVNGLTKLKDIKYLTRKEKQAGNFMKLLLSVAQDLRVVIIKFADRIHNMETIIHLPKIKRHRIAMETRDIYIPLAHRMGMSSVKFQLEDLVFQVLSPKDYKEIKSKVKSSTKQRMRFINEVIKPIEIELNKKQNGKQFLDLGWTSKELINFIPLEKVNQNILNKVPKICGVAFIKKSYFKNGIVIAHEGYLINRKNLIHASSKEKMTVNVDFFTYLFEKEKGRFDGVMFYDIKEG